MVKNGAIEMKAIITVVGKDQRKESYTGVAT